MLATRRGVLLDGWPWRKSRSTCRRDGVVGSYEYGSSNYPTLAEACHSIPAFKVKLGYKLSPLVQ